MKKSKFSYSQIIGYIKRAQVGEPVPTLCREGGFRTATFYKWRSKYGGMDVSMMIRVKELEEEEPAPEEDVRGVEDGCGDLDGSFRKKMVRPSQRREMATWAVKTRPSGERGYQPAVGSVRP